MECSVYITLQKEHTSRKDTHLLDSIIFQPAGALHHGQRPALADGIHAFNPGQEGRKEAQEQIDSDDNEPERLPYPAVGEPEQSHREGGLGPSDGGDRHSGADEDGEKETVDARRLEVPAVFPIAVIVDEVGGQDDVDEKEHPRGDQDPVVPPEPAPAEVHLTENSEAEEERGEDGHGPCRCYQGGTSVVVREESELLRRERRPHHIHVCGCVCRIL